MTIERVFRAAAVVLAVWIPVLAVSLVASGASASQLVGWLALDVAELVGVAVILRGAAAPAGRPARWAAPVTAALFVTDALIDTSTATPGSAFVVAAVMALFAELPMALLCLRMWGRRTAMGSSRAHVAA